MMMNILILFTLSTVCADIYFHNTRGSNNRLNENTFDRKNDKRLFDSQNNNRGGYNVGSLFYYHGSQIRLEWTSQHSCGGDNNNCELIIQYMCDDNIRDGETTKTIPENAESDLDPEYGRQESYDHYLKCRTRERNKRLFTADQVLKRQTAIATRQNPGATRYGFECAEERDYYPYWHGSPWRDVAVLTSNVSRCDFYQSESQNVKERWECVFTREQLIQIKIKNKIVPNNEADCQTETPLGFRGEWTKIASHGIAAPDCREVQFTRDNHLGNTVGMVTPSYMFTVPEVDSHSCVLRIRYNISTNDFDSWSVDSNNNGEKKKVSNIKLTATNGMSTKDAVERGYYFKNNPQVQIFKDGPFKLELAVNTAQYGRTFQDRSHVMGFRPRPPELQGTKIHNINVRGKRGNIVQVYPAVEYDFVPNLLDMQSGDYVHFQWTGSDQNPKNADGNGRAGTDRSNVVRLTPQQYSEMNKEAYGLDEKIGYFGNNKAEHLNNSQFLGLEREPLENLAFLSNVQYGGLMSQLDDASPYFNLAPQKVTKTGTYYYMSTRNNDFSNRDQKASIHVYPYAVVSSFIGQTGGVVTVSDSVQMMVQDGALCGLQEFQFQEWPADEGDAKAKKTGRSVQVGDGYASDYIVIYPLKTYCLHTNRYIEISLALQGDETDISIYRTNPETFVAWTKIDSTIKSDNDKHRVSFQIDRGGAYVARINTSRHIGLIVGCVVAIVIVVLLIGTFLYFRKHPGKFQKVTGRVRNAKRGMDNMI